MKKICKNCKFWEEVNKRGDLYWKCDSDKFVYNQFQDFEGLPLDGFVYFDYEEYSAGFKTGPEFGCIHWNEKI